jgi:hypothetical protein
MRKVFVNLASNIPWYFILTEQLDIVGEIKKDKIIFKFRENFLFLFHSKIQLCVLYTQSQVATFVTSLKECGWLSIMFFFYFIFYWLSIMYMLMFLPCFSWCIFMIVPACVGLYVHIFPTVLSCFSLWIYMMVLSCSSLYNSDGSSPLYMYISDGSAVLIFM